MIARTARLSGTPILELAGLEPALYRVVARDAERSEWGLLEELAAGQAELLGLIYALLARVLGGVNVEPLQLPRPEWAREAAKAGEAPAASSSSSAPSRDRIVMRAGDVARAMIAGGAAKRGDASR